MHASNVSRIDQSRVSLDLSCPHAKMTGIICETSLLAKENADHFKVYAKDPLVLMVIE